MREGLWYREPDVNHRIVGDNAMALVPTEAIRKAWEREVERTWGEGEAGMNRQRTG